MWGHPGTGQSCERKKAADLPVGEDEVYYKNRGDWWVGYEHHKSVIMDHFYKWIKYDELLKIPPPTATHVQYPLKAAILILWQNGHL